MTATGSLKRSSRKVAAAVPPATPPPMITIGLVLAAAAMHTILPQQGSAKRITGRVRSPDSAATCLGRSGTREWR